MNIDRATAIQARNRAAATARKGRVQRDVRRLDCGCEPTGTITVRKYDDYLTEWGYACKCGKTFKKYGQWRYPAS